MRMRKVLVVGWCSSMSLAVLLLITGGALSEYREPLLLKSDTEYLCFFLFHFILLRHCYIAMIYMYVISLLVSGFAYTNISVFMIYLP